MKALGASLPFSVAAHGSFKRQFMLTFSVGSFVLIATFVTYLVTAERAQIYADSTEHAFDLADALKVSSLQWVPGNDLAGLQEVVNAIHDHPELRYAMVLSPQGRVLAHSDPARIGQFLADESSLAFLKGPPQSRVITDDVSRVDVAVPIQFKTWHMGWARIALGREQVVAKLHKLVWSTVLFLVVATLLSLLAARGLANRLGAGISSLVGVADQVRRGNRAVRADAGRESEEIARLGESFNLMLDNLVESEARYRTLFEEVPISLWEEDFSAVRDYLKDLRASGITDFQQYFDDHPDEVVRLADKVVVLDVNRQTLKLFGVEDAEKPHLTLRAVFLPESLDTFKAELISLAEHQYHFGREIGLHTLRHTLRGKRIDILLNLIVPEGHEETLSRVLVAIVDITELKTFEEALRQSEERYRIIADFTYDCEYWQGPDGCLLYVSPSCEMQTGYRAEEFIDDPAQLARVVHPDDVAAFEHHMQHTREPVGPLDIDFRIIRRDGSTIWLNHVCRPVYGHDNEYLGRRVSNRDITERKRLETRLEETAAYARELIESSPDPLVIVSPDGRITDLNKRSEAVTGLSREQLIGSEYSDYCTDPDKARQAFMQVLTAGYANDVTLPVRHVSGNVTELLFNGVVLKGVTGEVQGVLASARDVTKLRHLERELRELNESLERRIEEEVARSHEKDLMLIEQSQQAARELQALNESLEQRVAFEVAESRGKDHMLIQQSRLAAMGEMVHNIAHQWRQPLHALSIILSNIRDGYALHELTQESLDAEIQRARALLKQMSATVDDFRDFFRPEREAAEFEIAEAVQDALSVMDATLKDKRIEVVESLPSGLMAYGYHNQFAQAVLNLVANAKEAIQEQEVPHGRVEVSLTRSGDSAILTIQDNGGGISEEILPKIFDPYFTTKEQGSGIGLYMTKIIIQRNHRGTIEAANVGPGTRFVISLPLVKEDRPS